MSWLYILYPFTVLYGFITWIRNLLYDLGWFKSYHATSLRVLNVGNLTVGGTGKTPHVEMLIRKFADRYQTVTLSRGYGRQTKGFRIASPADSPATLGDEPYQLYQKFCLACPHPKIQVTVGEKRAPAIQKIEALNPKVELVMLDDAFQHRAISAHTNILLTDFGRLFYQDLPFPMGRLREGRQGARRSDVVIVSKCPPTLPAQDRQKIAQHIQRYTRKGTPIFFTSLRYTFQSTSTLPANRASIGLLTGIAQPKPLVDYLQKSYTIQRHWQFADHHAYTSADLQGLEDLPIFTTEKDWVKLCQPALLPFLAGRQVHVVLIEPFFLEAEEAFWELLRW